MEVMQKTMEASRKAFALALSDLDQSLIVSNLEDIQVTVGSRIRCTFRTEARLFEGFVFLMGDVAYVWLPTARRDREEASTPLREWSKVEKVEERCAEMFPAA